MKSVYMQARTGNPFNTQLKMLHHPEKLAEYKITDDTTPILVEINLTNKCSLRCPWCFTDRLRKNEEINADHLLRFLEEFKASGGKAVNWSGGGEPTMHSRFAYIISKTYELGLEQGLMTNGIYDHTNIIEKYCKWVRFSVDYSNPTMYKDNKGVDRLHIVKKNIININKNKIKVGINKNLEHDDPEYIDNIYNMIAFAQECDVDYFQVRPALPNLGQPIQDVEAFRKQRDFLYNIDGHVYGKTRVVISRDKYDDLITPIGGRYYHDCCSHIFEPAIDANGDICVCMYQMKKPEFIMGNIYHSNFTDIWNSEQRKQVVKTCKGLDFSQCQVCCKGHEINKLMHYINHDKGDVNFI